MDHVMHHNPPHSDVTQHETRHTVFVIQWMRCMAAFAYVRVDRTWKKSLTQTVHFAFDLVYRQPRVRASTFIGLSFRLK